MCEIRLTALRDPKGGYIICGSWIAFSLGEKVAFAKQMTDEGLPKAAISSSAIIIVFIRLRESPSSVAFRASFPPKGEAIPYQSLYALQLLHKLAHAGLDVLSGAVNG